MPSMPVGFWNDPDGARYRESYFDMYPGIWRHGDWIEILPDGGCIIYGRSDATLNRGGVWMGTSEFYRAVEAFAEVADSLVVDTGRLGAEGRLIRFVLHTDGCERSAQRLVTGGSPGGRPPGEGTVHKGVDAMPDGYDDEAREALLAKAAQAWEHDPALDPRALDPRALGDGSGEDDVLCFLRA